MVEPTHLKNILVKLDRFISPSRGENNKIFETTTKDSIKIPPKRNTPRKYGSTASWGVDFPISKSLDPNLQLQVVKFSRQRSALPDGRSWILKPHNWCNMGEMVEMKSSIYALIGNWVLYEIVPELFAGFSSCIQICEFFFWCFWEGLWTHFTRLLKTFFWADDDDCMKG